MTQYQPSEPAPTPVVMEDADAADANKNKVYGILAYFGLLFLVPLLAAKDSRFAKYHANQGLVLFLFWIVVVVAGSLPILGHLIRYVGHLAWLVLFVLGIVNAAQGVKKPLPLIGGITIIN